MVTRDFRGTTYTVKDGLGDGLAIKGTALF
jgi:hypothetical protein